MGHYPSTRVLKSAPSNSQEDDRLLLFSSELVTVVDDAHVAGHYVVYGNVTLKDTHTWCALAPTGLQAAHWKERRVGLESPRFDPNS